MGLATCLRCEPLTLSCLPLRKGLRRIGLKPTGVAGAAGAVAGAVAADAAAVWC